MSHAPHADSGKEIHKTLSVKLAIWAGIGLMCLVAVIYLLAQFAIGVYDGRSLENDAAMAPEAVARRIAPVAKLELAVAPAPAGAKAAPVAATQAAPAAAPKAASAPAAEPKVATVAATPAKGGKAVYDTACVACHATGAAGAPKMGDKSAWAPRIKTGMEALYASALKGKGVMPAKGGNAALSDADAKAAVDYLVAGSK